jgi:hypothetical protein
MLFVMGGRISAPISSLENFAKDLEEGRAERGPEFLPLVGQNFRGYGSPTGRFRPCL